MTEKEKMLAGEIYSAVDPQLIEELTEVKEIIHDYNLLRPSEKEEAREILKGLLGHIADDNILINQLCQLQLHRTRRSPSHHRRRLLYRPECKHLHSLP